MPEIAWNAEVRSCRNLHNLEKVRLLNYKEVYGNKDDNDSSSENEEDKSKVIKMEMQWREESQFGNYGPYLRDEVKVKTYYLDKQMLEHFVNELKVQLNKWKVHDVACELL